MQEPKDIAHQLRAFLGCCQQLNQYIKDYGIIAKPLHNITKKGVKGPPPWVKGSEYDITFHKLKAIIANSKLYLITNLTSQLDTIRGTKVDTQLGEDTTDNGAYVLVDANSDMSFLL